MSAFLLRFQAGRRRMGIAIFGLGFAPAFPYSAIRSDVENDVRFFWLPATDGVAF